MLRIVLAQLNPHSKALLITSLGVLILSLEALFIKLTTISSVTLAFYVGILMFVSINFILLFQHKTRIIHEYKGNIKILLITAFLSGTSNILFISAIKISSVANVVLILASSPIFAAFFAYIVYREKSSKGIYISSFFIFIGLYFIIGSELGSGSLWGSIFALGCASSFAVTFVILSKHIEINVYTVAALAGIFSMSGAVLFIDNFSVDLYTAFIIACMGLLIAPISRVLINMGTKTLPGSQVSLLMIIETVMAPIWVWLFLDEIPHSSTFIGGGIILITLLINSYFIVKKSV